MSKPDNNEPADEDEDEDEEEEEDDAGVQEERRRSRCRLLDRRVVVRSAIVVSSCVVLLVRYRYNRSLFVMVILHVVRTVSPEENLMATVNINLQVTLFVLNPQPF